jgi:hypothetical protein
MTVVLTFLHRACFTRNRQDAQTNPADPSFSTLAAYSCGPSLELCYPNFLVPKLMDNLLKAQIYQARTSLRRTLANPSSA